MNYGCINRGKIGSNGAEINTQLLQLRVSKARAKQTHAFYHRVGEKSWASLLPKSPSSVTLALLQLRSTGRAAGWQLCWLHGVGRSCSVDGLTSPETGKCFQLDSEPGVSPSWRDRGEPAPNSQLTPWLSSLVKSHKPLRQPGSHFKSAKSMSPLISSFSECQSQPQTLRAQAAVCSLAWCGGCLGMLVLLLCPRGCRTTRSCLTPLVPLTHQRLPHWAFGWKQPLCRSSHFQK